MSKVDSSRDYYGDLEISSTADNNDIKKQFKKLALTYHPDRNPGRETEVIAQFQRIQSANEILSDPQLRAKYDASRRPNTWNKSGYSNVRGNPWSNVSSQYPPPPKAPGPRAKPPPSAGAARYKNFETPKSSASQTAYEGAEARKKTYEAWESMRGHESKAHPGSSRSWKSPSAKTYTASSGREESNSYKHAPPPKMKPGYDEYGAHSSPNNSSDQRPESAGSSNRKGFTPNTFGGDEPPAPKGNYSTQRNKPQQAPPPPPRAPPFMNNSHPDPPQPQYRPDPLKQFREQADLASEPRLSTPYATHGGEKLNPFESINLNRSKSTRESSERDDPLRNAPKRASQPGVKAPRRSHSFGAAEKKYPTGYSAKAATDDTSSDSSEGGSAVPSQPATGRKFAKAKGARTGPNRRSEPNLTDNNYNPPSSSEQSKSQSKGEPSMYGTSSPYAFSASQTSTPSAKLPTVSGAFSQGDRCLNFIHGPYVVSPTPSGVGQSHKLNSFEAAQRSLLDQLLNKRQGSETYSNNPSHDSKEKSSSQKLPQSEYGEATPNTTNCWNSYREPFHYPFKKPRALHTSRFLRSDTSSNTTSCDGANSDDYSFSFPNITDDTFASTKAHPHPSASASASSENINMTFSPGEWEGKFEAGSEYFKPEQKATSIPHHRLSQSGTRPRGRSPTKVRSDDPLNSFLPPRVPEKIPVESPGGTKFTPEEWAQSFQPQNFMPPPISQTSSKSSGAARNASTRKGRMPSLRQTMGTAALVDESDTSEERTILKDRKPADSSFSPSPDAMDVDTPPVASQTSTAKEAFNLKTDHLKRPVGPSEPQSPIDNDAFLKVQFEDLNIKDFLSSLKLPAVPQPPTVPETTSPDFQAAYEIYVASFSVYMESWDLFVKQIMLHLVARSTQTKKLGTLRWLDKDAMKIYRDGLKEDAIVLEHLRLAEEGQSHLYKEYAVLVEKNAQLQQRPRKKTF